ncbi:MAG: PilT/PilU family type 4a pilus ATPase [Bdellovibrionales bacterium]|nr:PilT/PilU family type 4a pilus ATPase [Bdellovibrionales bacterium]
MTIEQLLAFMIQHDSSDLFVTAGRPPSFKISGGVKPAGKQPLSNEDTIRLAQSCMDEADWNEFLQKKEQNIALYYPEIGRFRLNAYYQKKSVALVIRKIPTEILSLDDLKLPDVLRSVSMVSRGLVLVVGATGSGKSTTLAAMIDHRNRNEAGHIVTIEDPVEFVHEHKKCVVSQREVGVDTDSFKAALKNTLRQAPTVILIGEIRDEETMEYAINFAETGHLCLATLHSNNANQAMERVMNFFPPERHRQIYLQLSLNLKGIISQRLIKTKEGGRAAAIEVLLGTARVRELIKQGEVDAIKDAMEKGTNEGMQTFDQALLRLALDGRISEEEALKNADSVADLKLKIKLAQVGAGKNGGSVPGEGATLDALDGGFSLDDETPEPSAPEGELQSPTETPA